MSGGHFSYNQYKIEEIADDIEDVLKLNGEIIPFDELDFWQRRNYDPNNPYKYYDFIPEVIDKFKEGINIIRKAYVYAQRIDWLLSGDDGEETFLERLEEDLDEIKEV